MFPVVIPIKLKYFYCAYLITEYYNVKKNIFILQLK